MSEALRPPIAGRYELVSLLGQGSFGRTYLARDLAEDGRKVAVKQLRTTDVEAWKQVELFEREAAALRSLRHQGPGDLRSPARILPIAMVGTSRSRRARIVRFLRDGKPAEGRVLQVERGFDSLEVTYEFLVDGVPRRGGEANPRPSPRRLQPGDRISVLYIADEEYDSVIVGTQ